MNTKLVTISNRAYLFNRTLEEIHNLGTDKADIYVTAKVK